MLRPTAEGCLAQAARIWCQTKNAILENLRKNHKKLGKNAIFLHFFAIFAQIIKFFWFFEVGIIFALQNLKINILKNLQIKGLR